MQVFRLTQAEINARLPGVGGVDYRQCPLRRRGLSVCRHFDNSFTGLPGETTRKAWVSGRGSLETFMQSLKSRAALMSLNEESNGKGWIAGGGFQRLVGAGIWIWLFASQHDLLPQENYCEFHKTEFFAFLIFLPLVNYSTGSVRRSDGPGHRAPTGCGSATESGTTAAACRAIALYPDALVAQVLAAATYPDQIVEADRWLRSTLISRESNLTGGRQAILGSGALKRPMSFRLCSRTWTKSFRTSSLAMPTSTRSRM
jgi:hypothetical protein